jgi:hypothetical protein
MPDEIVRSYLFDRPGHYQIRVVGSLSKSWLDHLEGLEISSTPWGGYPQVMQINGWLADQTALAGLLDMLTDLGLVILTVERREIDKESHS